MIIKVITSYMYTHQNTPNFFKPVAFYSFNPRWVRVSWYSSNRENKKVRNLEIRINMTDRFKNFFASCPAVRDCTF